MKILAGIVLIFSVSTAHAEVSSVEIPGQKWRVNYDLPPVQTISTKTEKNEFSITGASDRLTISLRVGDPACTNDAQPNQMLDCFLKRVSLVPGFRMETVRASEFKGGVRVSYVTYTPAGDVAVKIMHTNLLFQHQGKAGDLHISVVKPTVNDIAMLVTADATFSISDIEESSKGPLN